MLFNYIVFDIDTTGLDIEHDYINKICAIKYENGIKKGKYYKLFSYSTEKRIVREFLKWSEGYILISHNYNGYIKPFIRRITDIENKYIDTLEISKYLFSNLKTHCLEKIAELFNIVYEENDNMIERVCLLNELINKMNEKINIQNFIFNSQYERIELHLYTMMNKNSIIKPKELIEHLSNFKKETIALIDYNSCASFPIFEKYLNNCSKNKIKFIYGSELDVLINNQKIRIVILVKNQNGLNNLYNIITLNNTKYLNEIMKIEEIYDLQDGLLIGLDISNKNVIKYIKELEESEIIKLFNQFDYLETTPAEYLIDLIEIEFKNIRMIRKYLLSLIKLANDNHKLVIAVSKAHYINKEDKLSCEVLLNKNYLPDSYIMSSDEMFDSFYYLGFSLAKKIIVDNPKLINNLIGNIKIIHDNFLPIKNDNYKKIFKNYIKNKLNELYGKNIPDVILKRVELELDNFKNDNIFLILNDLINYSKQLGYQTISRGYINSSFIAYLLGITDINPLPAHYYCIKCKNVIFVQETYGFDLPNKKCECGYEFTKDGYDLEYNASKLNFNINFASEISNDILDYLKNNFQNIKIFNYKVDSYFNESDIKTMINNYSIKYNINLNDKEISNIVQDLKGVKKSEGIHPAKILIGDNKVSFPIEKSKYSDGYIIQIITIFDILR